MKKVVMGTAVTIEQMVAEGSCTAAWAARSGYAWNALVVGGDALKKRTEWLAGQAKVAGAAQSGTCDRRGLATWCNGIGVKQVQLRSQCAGNGKRNEFLGDVVNMCAVCRKSNTGGFKIIRS